MIGANTWTVKQLLAHRVQQGFSGIHHGRAGPSTSASSGLGSKHLYPGRILISLEARQGGKGPSVSLLDIFHPACANARPDRDAREQVDRESARS